MKISNEIKVGALTLIGIVTLILGFYYLQGVDIFNRTIKVHVLLEDAANIKPANPVSMYGKQIGKVSAVKFQRIGNFNVVFDLNIGSDVEIQKNSIVKIIELNLLGDKELRIIKPDEFVGFLEEDDTLYGEIKGNIFASVENKISPIIEKTEPLLDNMDSLVQNINSLLKRNQQVIDATLATLERTMKNFESISKRVDDLMANQSDNIEDIMQNAKDLTETFANNTNQIDSILANINTLTGKISALELEPLMQSAQTALDEINKVLAALNEAEGTLGKIIYEDGLYEGLDSTMTSINALINDLKANPGRYVSFSLIERKEKKKE